MGSRHFKFCEGKIVHRTNHSSPVPLDSPPYRVSGSQTGSPSRYTCFVQQVPSRSTRKVRIQYSRCNADYYTTEPAAREDILRREFDILRIHAEDTSSMAERRQNQKRQGKGLKKHLISNKRMVRLPQTPVDEARRPSFVADESSGPPHNTAVEDSVVERRHRVG